jgi:hypothetical protein
MAFNFFGTEFSTKISCEFVCYSIHNMVLLMLLFSIIHQVEYYIMTFNSALIFSILTPILLALSIYLIYLFRNEKINKMTLIILLAMCAGTFVMMYLYTKNEIYDTDNYEAFFGNYFIYLGILVVVWSFLSRLEKYLIELGSRKAVNPK